MPRAATAKALAGFGGKGGLTKIRDPQLIKKIHQSTLIDEFLASSICRFSAVSAKNRAFGSYIHCKTEKGLRTSSHFKAVGQAIMRPGNPLPNRERQPKVVTRDSDDCKNAKATCVRVR